MSDEPAPCPGETEYEWGNIATHTGQFVPAGSEELARLWSTFHNRPKLARRCVGPVQLVEGGDGTQT